MHKKRNILIGVICLFLVASATAGVWYFGYGRKKAAAVSVLGQTSESDSNLSTENANSNDTPLSGQQQTGTSTGTGGQSTNLQSNLGQQSTPSKPKIPGPEEFGQYDKYKDYTYALYADLQAGTGAEAVVGKKVALVYKGWLTNGQLFDQSRTDPTSGKTMAFQFTLGATPRQVILGWEQGIVGMKVGGYRRLIVPPAVGYGSTGNGPVPGNAVMVFDVQLVAVQ